MKLSTTSLAASKVETIPQGKDYPRFIEHFFPLKQASLDSVHEKNVRHGHISTLHVWPARRPLAACRAALVTTLLPDPVLPELRKEILERLAGKVVQVPQKKRLPNGQFKVDHREETVGGILHWGRETDPDLEWFRGKIREVFGGRAPRVLDPFAGGGAIPFEAMRLGCEATAGDINPVAWLILKCTLEYPQRLAGQKRRLPLFEMDNMDFMQEYTNIKDKRPKMHNGSKEEHNQSRLVGAPEVDLSWHVRAWGLWVLQRAKKSLEIYYPVVDNKPSVAYLWARTVRCKNCRATIPLLKTRWLCRRSNKRVLLTMDPRPDRSGVIFGIQTGVPIHGTNAMQRREHDKRIGQGTMNRNGARCPCCGQPGTVAMQIEDIRHEGVQGRLGAMMTAVVVDGPEGKEYRLPTPREVGLAGEAEKNLDRVFAEIPFGIPNELTPIGGSGASRAFSVDGYGFDKWFKLFTPRQLLTIGTFVMQARAAFEAMRKDGYADQWLEAITGYIGILIDKVVDRGSMQCIWISTNAEKAAGSFGRFALPITWDFAEVMPWSKSAGGFLGSLERVSEFIRHALAGATGEPPQVLLRSAIRADEHQKYDLVVTDPPYYDAIPYSDLMDFYYVWLRRTLNCVTSQFTESFSTPLGPKWDKNENDGELIDDSSRYGGDGESSRIAYERGMSRAFKACEEALKPEGRLVVVFANKQPAAWEALVSGMIGAGFVVDGSWPIQTERTGRLRSQSSAALSSSVWLVCRKRPLSALLGWDNQVLGEMQKNIHERLREYWDIGIRGPDFVWAATGPALEAFSKHPAVKKANEPGAVMTVREFLRQVRRIVVDFVVGRVLSKDGDGSRASGLDDLTTYYLLHRHDFDFGDAPAGACILYAISCGLSDAALAHEYDLLVRTGGTSNNEEDTSIEEDPEVEPEQGSGSTLRLKTWNQRRSKTLGYDSGSRPAPLIDRIHHLMHLWRSGDVGQVDAYLDSSGLVQNDIFHQVLQALVELSAERSEERSLLESISNHIIAKGGHARTPKSILDYAPAKLDGENNQ